MNDMKSLPGNSELHYGEYLNSLPDHNAFNTRLAKDFNSLRGNNELQDW